MLLIPIDIAGETPGCDRTSSPEIEPVIKSTVSLYQRVGFVEPWIGYLASCANEIVGTCGFKSPPVDGRVEIAYFTFPRFEGRGIATRMAAQLLALARQTDGKIRITAQTLVPRNGSHRILEKLGFERVGQIQHPDDGLILEWCLADK